MELDRVNRQTILVQFSFILIAMTKGERFTLSIIRGGGSSIERYGNKVNRRDNNPF